jgi:aminopeptidase N
VNTACEEEGASVWWPNKDQWRDEPDSMDISIEAPSDLQEVSGGRFVGKEDLHDGFTRWNWHVSYPINNYDVSLNIGRYEHFADRWRDLTLDYFVFPEDLPQARRQFVQVRDMLDAFVHYFGEYPFPRDGYKLVEALYSGVENQTAITYGNGFGNGYLGRPASGIGQKFDFIIVHESAHEWFGNSLTAKDRSDMWIQEGWANYLETLFVEYRWGKADAITYLNTGKEHVKNAEPVISPAGVFSTPPVDQYKKGALFLNTVRSVLDDDEEWFRLLHDYYQHFKYQTLMTADVLKFFNEHTHRDFGLLFEQYLRHAAIPVLEWKFDAPAKTVVYRFQSEVPGFHMPVRVSVSGSSEVIEPGPDWQTLAGVERPDAFGVATDYYYLNVKRLDP